MFSRPFSLSRMALVGFCLSTAALMSSAGIRAQDIPTQEQDAPPPLRVVPPSDRSRLDEERSLKDRVKACGEILGMHLMQAEQFTASSLFDEAAAELGVYHAVIDDTLQYLGASVDRGNKLRDAYKRLELALRSHAPRIETIRRQTPREYSMNVKRVADFARDARSQALNAFYGDTVLREPKEPLIKPDKSRSDAPPGP